jgi:hypothetical protein
MNIQYEPSKSPSFKFGTGNARGASGEIRTPVCECKQTLNKLVAHRHGVSSNELFATLQDWEYTLKRSPSALAIIKGEKIPTSKINETSSSQTDLVIWQAKSPAKYKRRPSRIAGG